MLRLVAEILATGALLSLAAFAVVVAWPWRLEGTMKAATSGSVVSLALGASLGGLSASAAALLGGPGVVAVHLRARELWRRPIPRVSLEALLAWLDDVLSKPKSDAPTFLSRLFARARAWLLPRTDTDALPGFGLDLLRTLREPRLSGALHCGFVDPAVTGKVAAWLYPLAGILAPLGVLDVRFDWSGKTRIDADAEVSCRVVFARVLWECARFTLRHVHPLRAPAPLSNASSSLQT